MISSPQRPLSQAPDELHIHVLTDFAAFGADDLQDAIGYRR
jgi:hypothetical protein